MFDWRDAGPRRLHRLVDFVVLGATFYVSCVYLSVELRDSFLLHLLAYAAISLVFVRLSKRAIANHCKVLGESTRQILGNAIGISIGTCILLPLEKLRLNTGDMTSAMIFSGVMAFFVLGTISPLLQKTSLVRKCRANYDFDRIADFAKKRFVDGINTVALLERAESIREKEEIALVCLLDVEDDKIRDLQLCCTHSRICKVMDCRDRLKKIIEKELRQQVFA